MGAPFKIAASYGPIAQAPAGAFQWHSISLAGHAFGVLAPSTPYWVSLLPGAPYSDAEGLRLYGAHGIQWGGLADGTAAAAGGGGGAPALPLDGQAMAYAAVEIGSQSSPDDAKYGCARHKALERLHGTSQWGTLPPYDLAKRSRSGRFENFKTWGSVLRHGIVLHGTSSS